jgi:hypothetical protein
MRRSFGAALVRLLRRILAARLTDRYRPELHYMRGPGPKSRGRQPAADGNGMAASPGIGGKSPGA